MSLLAADDLKTLVEQPKGRCISLYLPMERLSQETRQNPIRFKNLVRQAEVKLGEFGFSQKEIQDLLQPLETLNDDDFWQHQDQGLAVFLTDGFMKYYCLPIAFQELVVVSDRFHLKPLMPLLTGDGEFFILALSQKDVRFFRATRDSVDEISLWDMPKSVDEALLYDSPTNREGHIRTGGGLGSHGGSTAGQNQVGSAHGHGSPDRDRPKDNILQFFHIVDRGLQEHLHDKHGPLVIAGVDFLLPVYQEANTYTGLLIHGISDNPELMTPQSLHQQAWTVVEPHFAQAQQAALERYRELAGTGQTSTQVEEIVPAAYYGRVDELFVAVGVQQWGLFDAERNDLQVHETAEPGDDDLLNEAAIQTFLHGGTVYAVRPEEVPDGKPLTAVFRYS
ncbi:MAG: hypothetical protein MUF49_08040 [Oculatellaceae cyanobacterium Prado106]|nr:hypothetical protein [Oculatellaceae cyanobacterium Prado106]